MKTHISHSKGTLSNEEELSIRMQEICKLLNCESLDDCQKWWYKLMERLDLETDLIKISSNRMNLLEEIVEGVNIERLNNHPIELNEKELKKVLVHSK